MGDNEFPSMDINGRSPMVGLLGNPKNNMDAFGVPPF